MSTITNKETNTRYILGMLAATAVPIIAGLACFITSAENIGFSCFMSLEKYENCLSSKGSSNTETIIFALCGYFLVIGGIIAGIIGSYKIYRQTKRTTFIPADKINTIAVRTTLWGHMWLVIIFTADPQIIGSPMGPGSWQLGDYFFSLPFVAFASIPFLAIAIPLGLLAGTLFKWVVYRRK